MLTKLYLINFIFKFNQIEDKMVQHLLSYTVKFIVLYCQMNTDHILNHNGADTYK